MTSREPLNPWKLSAYQPGQRVVCRIIDSEPGGYTVHIRKDNFPGFLSTTAHLKVNEEIVAEFVGAESHRVLLGPDTDRPRPVIDLTKCHELDRKIVEAKTLGHAKLVASEILKELVADSEILDQRAESSRHTIVTALVLNIGRFFVPGEPALRRMRDILDCDLDTLNSLSCRKQDEYELFIDFKKVPDPLDVMDRLSAQLSKIVQWPSRGTRTKL